jgi:archaellum component FlaC
MRGGGLRSNKMKLFREKLAIEIDNDLVLVIENENIKKYILKQQSKVEALEKEKEELIRLLKEANAYLKIFSKDKIINSDVKQFFIDSCYIKSFREAITRNCT